LIHASKETATANKLKHTLCPIYIYILQPVLSTLKKKNSSISQGNNYMFVSDVYCNDRNYWKGRLSPKSTL